MVYSRTDEDSGTGMITFGLFHILIAIFVILGLCILVVRNIFDWIRNDTSLDD